jgi:hypothetical protein
MGFASTWKLDSVGDPDTLVDGGRRVRVAQLKLTFRPVKTANR